MMTLVLLPGMDGTGTLNKTFIKEIKDINSQYIIKHVNHPLDEPLNYSDLEK